MDGLTEGRIVHYVLREGRGKGEHRAAIVAKVWRDAAGKSPASGCSTLVVFTVPMYDGSLETAREAPSVLFDASGEPGTWHWIEKA